jgi:hypothetical protein
MAVVVKCGVENPERWSYACGNGQGGAAMRGLRWTISWFFAIFLALMFLWFSDQTLFPADESKNVFFPLLAENAGFVYFEPTGRALTGVLQAVAAALILLPWTRRFGAVLGCLIAGFAVTGHAVWVGHALPTAVSASDADGGQVFYLSLGLLATCLCLVFTHPPGNDRSPADEPDY